MGIFINRNNVIDKAQAMRKNIYETKHQASLIFQSINNFDDTKYELMGKAWGFSAAAFKLRLITVFPGIFKLTF